MDTIGTRIKGLRKEQNLSQESFGEKINVSRDVINNLERDRIGLKEHYIKLIALEYKVNEHWLLTGEGDKNAASNTENLASLLVDIKTGRKPFAAKYIDFLASLTDAEWEIFEKQTKIMKRFYEEIDEAECEDM